MATIEELEERLNTFEETLIQLSRDMVPVVGKVDHTANDVEALTPYQDTKTAYIGDTEVVFQNKQGNLLIYTDKPFPYSVDRNDDFIVVNFEPLEEVSQITISIQ